MQIILKEKPKESIEVESTRVNHMNFFVSVKGNNEYDAILIFAGDWSPHVFGWRSTVSRPNMHCEGDTLVEAISNKLKCNRIKVYGFETAKEFGIFLSQLSGD